RLEARAQERRDPDRDHRRDRARHVARRIGHHRDDLRVAGCGPPVSAGDLQPRLSGGAGGGLPALVHVRAGEPGRGRRLLLSRSAEPRGVSVPIGAGARELAGTRSRARREWVVFARRLARRRTALFGVVVVTVVVVAAIGAPWLSPYDPIEQDITNR